jgi:S-adenosylmethionine/arginine decarboxylase-like enzyme
MIHKHCIFTGKGIFEHKSQIENLLNDLVEAIDMQILGGPYIHRCDLKNNEGFTGLLAITTSHISIHTWDNELIQLDIYSCKEYDIDIAIKVLAKHGIYSIHHKILDRNIND